MTTNLKKGDLVHGNYDGSSIYLLGDSSLIKQGFWRDGVYATEDVEVFTARMIVDKRGRVVKNGSYCNNISTGYQGWEVFTPETLDARFKKEAEALEAKYAFVQGFLNK